MGSHQDKKDGRQYELVKINKRKRQKSREESNLKTTNFKRKPQTSKEKQNLWGGKIEIKINLKR